MEQLLEYIEGLIPKGLDLFLTLVIGFAVFFIGSKLIGKLLKLLRRSMTRHELDPGVVSFCISACRIAFYVLLIVIVAQIFGVATSSLVAIVGSAGLAIGLALQGSLANFAGGVLILVMKPFVVGDYIIVGDVEGTVQKIDVVYTTLITKDNRAAILPNGTLADSNIINATKEDKRRIDIQVGIEYGESIDKVKAVLEDIVESQDARLVDMPVNIVVSDLADSAVTMSVYLWVKPEDYWNVRWGMLEQIKKEFDRNGITIPFNQLDVHVER